MKREERLIIAIERYKKRLKQNGTSDFAINNALCCGIDFLMEYEQAHKPEVLTK